MVLMARRGPQVPVEPPGQLGQLARPGQPVRLGQPALLGQLARLGLRVPLPAPPVQVLFNLAGVTAGATNLCIDDANSRVGVGTTSPSTALEAIGTSRFSRADATPVGTASTTNDDAVFGSTDTTNAGVTFFSSGTSGINFGDAADNDVGQIRYDNSTNKLFFRTNASDRVTIDAAGNVGLGTATPGFDLHVQAPGGITAKFE